MQGARGGVVDEKKREISELVRSSARVFFSPCRRTVALVNEVAPGMMPGATVACR